MSKCPSAQGFSLLEMIAVMAIVAILASSLAPSVLRSIQTAEGDAEEQTLVALGEALEDYVRETKRVPSPATSDWPAALAQIAHTAEDRILANERGFQRRLYYDPRFFTTTDSAFGGFTQNRGLIAAPVSPRVMIVSNLDANLPAAPTTSAAFEAIWTQDTSAAVQESRRVKVHRINLSSAFHRVLLTNANSSAATYVLETGDTGSVPARTGSVDGMLERFVIDGTKIELRAAPYPSSTVHSAHLVRRAVSYRYASPDGGTTWDWNPS